MSKPTIRTLRRDEREAVLDLLDEWPLSDGWRGRDYFRRYIDCDPTYVDENFHVAEQDGALVSCVQIFPRLLRVGGAAVPVGGIGSVFTSEKVRGSGLVALLGVGAAMPEAAWKNAALRVAPRLYTRLGWTLYRVRAPLGSHRSAAAPARRCGRRPTPRAI
jgi:hypothetical protein